MPQTITLPDGYGYAAVIALGLVPALAFVQGMVVTNLRKAAGVPYPNPYATHQQAKENPAAHKFNCAQRAHANLLENMSQTMAFVLFSALEYPNAAKYLGLGWVVARALYAYGYINDKKTGKGRYLGGWFWFMQLPLLGLSVSTAIKLL
ncbi:hypothetical protein B0A52_03707 [Exophiala mesophila]|uniref:Glutathione S-transferase n=1 Tax=Exophiala mesophila TaxID=212818 RepID=A0A438N9T0_EXOME|nr:hypothetical protein B0A52_03707 [Exophiala mesophila]